LEIRVLRRQSRKLRSFAEVASSSCRVVSRSIARIRSALRPFGVLQALAVEALNDLPAKHGKRPNVKNPLLDQS
jgi:hypothetical protein